MPFDEFTQKHRRKSFVPSSKEFLCVEFRLIRLFVPISEGKFNRFFVEFEETNSTHCIFRIIFLFSKEVCFIKHFIKTILCYLKIPQIKCYLRIRVVFFF